jgi:L-alanine-DL-glutamate epimerase-like enolase superfamily enzyme
MEDGYLQVPMGPGIGREPDLEFLESITSSKEYIQF